jgi:hypothetical protein
VENPSGVIDNAIQDVLFDKCTPPVIVTPNITNNDDGNDGSTTTGCTATEPAEGCRKATGGKQPIWNPETCSCQ